MFQTVGPPRRLLLVCSVWGLRPIVARPWHLHEELPQLCDVIIEGRQGQSRLLLALLDEIPQTDAVHELKQTRTLLINYKTHECWADELQLSIKIVKIINGFWPGRSPRSSAVSAAGRVLLGFRLGRREDTNTCLRTDTNPDPDRSTYRPSYCRDTREQPNHLYFNTGSDLRAGREVSSPDPHQLKRKILYNNTKRRGK